MFLWHFVQWFSKTFSLLRVKFLSSLRQLKTCLFQIFFFSTTKQPHYSRHPVIWEPFPSPQFSLDECMYLKARQSSYCGQTLYFLIFCSIFLLTVCQWIAMASSYTSPLTVVRDVETSILDGTVLGFLYCMWGKGGEGKNSQGDWTNYKVCQHKQTQEGWKMYW